MMSETDFTAAMNANPADATLRLVYADWLDDQGRQGDGWRALGRLGLRPSDGDTWTWFEGFSLTGGIELPKDWFDALPPGNAVDLNGDPVTDFRQYFCVWRDYDTRHAAESAAAEAFLRLSPWRRTKLLRGVLT